MTPPHILSILLSELGDRRLSAWLRAPKKRVHTGTAHPRRQRALLKGKVPGKSTSSRKENFFLNLAPSSEITI